MENLVQRAEIFSKEIKEDKKLVSILMDNSPIPVLVTAPDSSIIYFNKAAEKITGFSRNEMIGTQVPYLFWPPDRKTEYFSEFQKDEFKSLRTLEKTFQTRQGKEFWVEMTLIPVKENRRLKYLISTWVNLTEEKKLRRELELYSRRIMEVQEAERKKVADELHDDTAQSLAILSLELDSLSRSKEIRNEKIIDRLNHLKEDTNRAMQAVRKYSYELRPGMLEHLGLTAALEQLVDEVNEKSPVRIQFKVRGREKELEGETRIGLFRIAQEALNNIVRHSRATESMVSLTFTPQKTRIDIQDNGQGFDLDQERNLAILGRSLGLVGMREWAKIIKASLKIESSPDTGTAVTVTVNN